MAGRICPMCGNVYVGYPALSRIDNKTEICPDCGQMEAFMDFFKGQEDWLKNLIENQDKKEEKR